MKSKRRHIICMSLTLMGAFLMLATPLFAHEKRFHIPKKTTTPLPEKEQLQKNTTTVVPEVKLQDKFSNTPVKKVVNSVSIAQTNEMNIIPQPGEIVLLLLLGGTFLLFYVKRWMYR